MSVSHSRAIYAACLGVHRGEMPGDSEDDLSVRRCRGCREARCATWFPFCSEEVPELITLQNRYASRGFTVVGFYMDGDTTAVPPYVAAHGINYPVLLTTSQMREDDGGIDFIPTLYLVDRTGKIAFGTEGSTSQADLAAQISKIL